MRVEFEVEQGGFGTVRCEAGIHATNPDYSTMPLSTLFTWEYSSDPVYITGPNRGRKVSDRVLAANADEIERTIVWAVEGL